MAGSTLTLTSDPHRGRMLGKYEILCRLSTGGMSEIFLAFQRGLAGFRKFVVLKQILPDPVGVLTMLGIDPDKRGEQLAIADFCRIARTLEDEGAR